MDIDAQKRAAAARALEFVQPGMRLGLGTGSTARHFVDLLEIAPDLSLIKGGGGALLREKIAAAASARMVVIADSSKWVEVLGRFPLPIEVVPFGLAATQRAVEAACAAARAPGPARLRRGADGHAFVTDGGHWILDAALGRIPAPEVLAERLAAIAGVVEHGLFIGLAQTAVIAGPEGVRVIERQKHPGGRVS